MGPTAVGKTDLCIQLARSLDTEIISADARQFFKQLNIGTAKPTISEMQGVKHHFIDILDIKEDYNAGKFEQDVLALLDHLFSTQNAVILTGGSGLYLKAVYEGIDEIPEIDPEIRNLLNKQQKTEGLESLIEKLKVLDPIYYQTVDKKNTQRIIRALEVCLSTNKPYSSFRVEKKAKRPFNIIKIGLTRDREELYERINTRMDNMIDKGLFKEGETLYPFKEFNALQTVGYKEIFDHIEGKYDHTEAIRLLKQNSRRYAKRQMTWFKKDKGIHWFHPNDIGLIKKHIEENT